MLTEKDYCDYDTCVALKELGYKEKSHAYYDSEDNVGLLYNTYWACDVAPCQYFDVLESHNTDTEHEIDALTLYDAQKWLREERQMILLPAYLNGANVWICEICYKRERLGFGGYNQTYEEALSEGIKEAVKILKEK